MRRAPLVWLIIGIVVGLLAAQVPSFLEGSKPETAYYLRFQSAYLEEWTELDGGSDADMEKKAEDPLSLPVLKKVWECGARDFATDLSAHDAVIAIPIKVENFKILNCAIKAADGADPALISLTITDSEA